MLPWKWIRMFVSSGHRFFSTSLAGKYNIKSTIPPQIKTQTARVWVCVLWVCNCVPLEVEVVYLKSRGKACSLSTGGKSELDGVSVWLWVQNAPAWSVMLEMWSPLWLFLALSGLHFQRVYQREMLWCLNSKLLLPSPGVRCHASGPAP